MGAEGWRVGRRGGGKGKLVRELRDALGLFGA